jgi:hypothetical protein
MNLIWCMGNPWHCLNVSLVFYVVPEYFINVRRKIIMFEKIRYKSIVLSSVLFVLCFAYNASATPITTSAEVVGNITVTQVTALNFGQFSVGVAGGVIDFDADAAAISASGDVLLIGGEAMGVAQLDTSGAGAGTPVTVTVTGATLTSGGNTMTVDANCKGPGAAPLGADNSPCGFISTGGADNVAIGGKLNVSANQPVGVYSGFIQVTAAF